MKKLSKLKLNELESEDLSNREMKRIVGGSSEDGSCYCACRYVYSGGSSSADNCAANLKIPGVYSYSGGVGGMKCQWLYS